MNRTYAVKLRRTEVTWVLVHVDGKDEHEARAKAHALDIEPRFWRFDHEFREVLEHEETSDSGSAGW